MRFKPLLFSSIFLYLSSSVALAAETHPKIGLVLAGGGAKGAAHIGVLKALEEMHIPIDYITGTSMGAYVGGLYASGLSADEIETFIDTVNWNSGFVDKVERSEREIRDKEYEDRYQIGTDIGFSFTELKAPKGFVQGQNMASILRSTSGNVSYLQSFDDLPIPFRAVATDIENLEPVILGKGNLAEAMMASMSVPGALPPVEYEGRLLVDGGSVNNMPVDVAKDMGADIIIAVDIGSDYLEAEDISSYLSVMGQLTNYIVKNSTKEQEKLLTAKDILLAPNVGKMETAEFNKMPFAYEKGYDVAYEQHLNLDKLVLPPAEYQAYLKEKEEKTRKLKRGDSLKIEHITLNNNSSYSERMLLEYLQIDEGKTYSSDELEAKVRALYTIDRFERVDYFYQTADDGATELVVDVNEKSWGPNYLDFRFSLEDDFYNQSKYSLGFSINFTDINIIGLSDNSSELRTNFELGTDKLMQAELYTPFLSNQLLFSSLKGTYSVTQAQFRPTPTLENIDNYLPTEYSEFEFEASLGIQAALWNDFRIGGRYTTGDVMLNIFPDFNSDYKRQGVFVQYRLDTLDNFTFPTKGFYLFSEYLYSEDELGEVNSSETINDSVVELTVNGRFAYTVDRHTLVVHGEYGVVENKNGGIPLEPKSLGGFLHLSGISKDSLSGENLAFASLVYRYRLMDNDFGLFQSPIYLGSSIEQGSIWNEEHFSDAPIYTAGSIFAGIDSPIGPIILAYGRTEQNHESVYLSIGATL